MPSRSPKQDVDYYNWAALEGDAKRPTLHIENILIELNGNNPPSVLQGTRFFVYAEHTVTLANVTTNNDAYPGNTEITYALPYVIFEQSDQTFTWGSGNFPSVSPSTTYYLYCSESDDDNAGVGTYGASTDAPTWDEDKGGWYDTNGYKVLATFVTDGSSNVNALEIYGAVLPNDTSTDLLRLTGKGQLDTIDPEDLKNYIAFRATAGSTFSVTTGPPAQMNVFTVETYDYGSGFNTTSSWFVAPVDGVYHFDVNIKFTSAITAALIYVGLYVDGAENNGTVKYNYSTIGGCVSGDIYLDAGKTVSVYIYGASATTSTAAASTNFSGHLVYAV